MQAIPGRWCKPPICSSGSWPNACGSGSLGHKTVTQDKIIMLDWFKGLSEDNIVVIVNADLKLTHFGLKTPIQI